MAVLEILETFNCGETETDKVTATLYNNGNLILRGIGSMKNYSTDLPPWFQKTKVLLI